jgi:DMSO/TMAO reductase YedYZ molybdopterin-dependent catalytic subunit
MVEATEWRLSLAGLIGDKTPWNLNRLHTLPQESQITRHICVEGWSQIGQWQGVPLRLRIPIKLGFKNPKYIQAIEVTNSNPGGYWEKQGYDWLSGL